MSLVLSKKPNGSLFPGIVESFFNGDRFFNQSFFGKDPAFFEFDRSITIPDANIIENETNYQVEVAAPGLEKKDFKVEVQNGVLHVSAEKKDSIEEKEKNYHRREFSYTSFSRSFTLPENSNTDKIEAKYDNGVLQLTLPKKEIVPAQPAKTIEVS